MLSIVLLSLHTATSDTPSCQVGTLGTYVPDDRIASKLEFKFVPNGILIL